MINRYAKISLILLLFSAVLYNSSCVYYNTFYNAKKAFNEAESARKKDQYARGRSRGSAKYKIAIDKSLKIIENHPNTKYYDDALHVLGVSYYHTENYSKAERRFRELLANYPESEYIKETEIYLAKTKLKLRDEKEAMELFENIFVSDFDKSFKAEAAMGLGTYHFNEKNYNESQPYFQAVRDSLGNSDERKIAQNFIADGYYNTFQFKNALGAYLQILGMDPDKIEKYHALFQASQCSFSLMKISEGMDYLKTLKEDELYFDSLGVLKLATAEALVIDGEYEEAEAIYKLLADDETNKQVAGKANYNLALMAQFDKDDLEAAKEYYDKTVSLVRGMEIGKDALQRSSDIGKVETFARKLVIDSTTAQEAIDEAAFTQLQLSQLYWFNLNKQDTAILEMQYLIDSFPTAYDVPNAMIALSQMYREYAQDSTTADSLLRQVLAEHPTSDRIPEVLELLELKDTEADSGYAELYMHKAENFLVDSTNLDSAKYYYQYVVDNFPESDYYLHARFALLWVMDEYESPGDSSLVFAYNAFVDSFPGTSWANEAKRKVKYTRKASSKDETDSTGVDSLGEDQYAADTEGEFDEEGGTTGEDEYLDPMVALYIDPDGEKAYDMPLNPDVIKDPFEYPVEAYRDAFEGSLYFQILLDFSGEVTDYILKISSNNEEIDREASEAVATMVFDIIRIPPEISESWFVYKFVVRKPDQLR